MRGMVNGEGAWRSHDSRDLDPPNGLLDFGASSAIFYSMPIYEYICEKCGADFEVIQKFSDPPLKKHEDCGGKLQKKLSLSAFHLKGGGWYADGYSQKKAEKQKTEKKDSNKSEKKTEKAKKKAEKKASTQSS